MTRSNIVITGASSGLGEGMARLFAAKGRNLALCARRTDRLERLRDELTGKHPGVAVHVRQLDVNDHAAVFDVFRGFDEDMGGGVDRVIVNAGLGKGQPIGTGRSDANIQTAQTNFVAALVQCEAAMEIFRARRSGHLVVVSSMSALRGMRGNLTTYAATKAGVAALAEGIRADVLRTPIKVSTVFPGYIRSEMNERIASRLPFIVDTETGCRALVAAIEKERPQARVPAWPWRPVGTAMRVLPLRWMARLG